MAMIKRLFTWVLCVMMAAMCFAVPSQASSDEEELSKEELLQLLSKTIPEGQEGDLNEYLVLPDDFVAPQTDMYQLLLIGTDTYSPKSRGRSDTMMLAQVDPKNKTIKLVSFLRDMYVKIPGKGTNRLNAAYAFGGPDLLLKTLKANFGIEPDAYVSVNFSRMADLIDAIGGVEVDVSSREISQLNGILQYYNRQMGKKQNDSMVRKAGLQTLNGRQALSFSRIRKIDSDFQRTDRQRTVIEAAFHKVMALSWDKIGELVLDNLDNVVTNISAADAIKLIPTAITAKDATFETMQIPIQGGYASKMISGMAVLVPSLTKNVNALDDFLYGKQGE
jgi:LCP family protein required for cell wall assembly